ncbi:MAG: MFS transporter [Chloroherpetonaceae bacterium]|nr:MFS transporter [Chloroherpetonaceae bacterium]MDW8437138.1 MFS transporter [Chloroherpetonaceae bacterium]
MRPLLLSLSAVYLTYMLDYMMMPALTQAFVKAFDSSAKELGALVSSYSLSASAFGLFGAMFLDRFNRKVALLSLYGGFALSLLFCALAPSAIHLIAARAIAGAFGGLMVATIFSVIGDQIAPERQGVAFGTVLSSFAIASVVGVPLGLFLAERFSWNAIFFLNAIASFVVWVGLLIQLPPMNAHLSRNDSRRAFSQAIEILSSRSNLAAFLVSALVAMASYAVIPFINPFLAANRGLSDSEIRWLYVAGGVATLLVSYPTGWLSDRFGKFRLFVAISFALVPLTLLFATMPTSSYALIALVFVLFMSLSRARRIPALALITSSVPPKVRAGFMSVNASFEQLFSGIAASLASLLVMRLPSGEIEGFLWAGVLSASVALMAAFCLRFVRPLAENDAPRPKPLGEALAK